MTHLITDMNYGQLAFLIAETWYEYAYLCNNESLKSEMIWILEEMDRVSDPRRSETSIKTSMDERIKEMEQSCDCIQNGETNQKWKVE